MTALIDFQDLEKVGSDILQKRQKFELQQWQKWKAGGETPDDVRPLLQSLKPLIKKEVNRFKGRVNMPPAAIDAEFNQQALNAFRTFDPQRGTRLSTHVRNNLQKAKRFVATYQNLGRIPEHRIWNIQRYHTANEQLEQQFGRPATTEELSENLGWPQPEVGRMRKELRRDLPASGFVSAEGASTDPYEMRPSREREVLRLVSHNLSPEEKLVYEHTYGMNGKAELRPGQIATQLKFSASKVSRLRKSITEKVRKYLG